MKPEQHLNELVTRLQNAAGSNLISVVLYGSAATEEFHAGHSDLNVLGITRSLGKDDLSRLSAAAVWWMKKGHPAPLFFTLEELKNSADVFAIEMLDIKAARRVLDGEDVFAALHVPMNLHRLHVERELRQNTLRLRQRYLLHPADKRRTLALMTESISTFAALFRHALIALEEEPPREKRGAINRLGAVLGFDPAPFHAILAVREKEKRERDVDVPATFDAYLQAVEKAADEMDRRLAAPAAAG